MLFGSCLDVGWTLLGALWPLLGAWRPFGVVFGRFWFRDPPTGALRRTGFGGPKGGVLEVWRLEVLEI